MGNMHMDRASMGVMLGYIHPFPEGPCAVAMQLFWHQDEVAGSLNHLNLMMPALDSNLRVVAFWSHKHDSHHAASDTRQPRAHLRLPEQRRHSLHSTGLNRCTQIWHGAAWHTALRPSP